MFDFASSDVPGVSGRERGYWRDIGTLDAYYDAHMDLISPDPIFNLYNADWPIHMAPDRQPPAKFVFEDPGHTGMAVDSMVCAGVIVSGARRPALGRSRPGCTSSSRAVVEGSVLHARRRTSARARSCGTRSSTRTSSIEPGARLGVDLDVDREALRRLAGRHRRGRQGRACRHLTVRAALLTREYPPDVYGGAGVHVEYLARELAKLVDVTVHCWGAAAPRRLAHRRSSRTSPGTSSPAARRTWRRCGRCRSTWRWPPGSRAPTLVHSHTWYANLGGHLAKLIHAIPHVATVHSLEPLRPWKEEQLGGGYRLSSFCERTGLEDADAIIAVSARDARRHPRRLSGDRPGPRDRDRQRHRHRRVPARPRHRPARALGIDPAAPIVVYVGRITRQKGLPHLLDAARELDPAAQLVLCASAPDTPELGEEVRAGGRRAARRRAPGALDRGDAPAAGR